MATQKQLVEVVVGDLTVVHCLDVVDEKPSELENGKHCAESPDLSTEDARMSSEEDSSPYGGDLFEESPWIPVRTAGITPSVSSSLTGKLPSPPYEVYHPGSDKSCKRDTKYRLYLPHTSGAFGDATHPTTRLCLWAMQNGHVSNGNTVATKIDFSNGRVLDYGCGSGILALFANLLGSAYAAGVDIQAVSVKAANENRAENFKSDRRNQSQTETQQNGVLHNTKDGHNDKVEFFLPPLSSLEKNPNFCYDYGPFDRERGEWTKLGKQNEMQGLEMFPEEERFEGGTWQKFDILLVNIVAGPLLLLADKLGKLCKPGGELILSGYLPMQISKLKEEYGRCGFKNLEEIGKEGQWGVMHGRKWME